MRTRRLYWQVGAGYQTSNKPEINWHVDIRYLDSSAGCISHFVDLGEHLNEPSILAIGLDTAENGLRTDLELPLEDAQYQGLGVAYRAA